jgi:hypothetical protein
VEGERVQEEVAGSWSLRAWAYCDRESAEVAQVQRLIVVWGESSWD